MPRLEFDPEERLKSSDAWHLARRFGDMDFAAALVAEDVAHSTATETRWIYMGPLDGTLHVGVGTYRGEVTRVISLRRASRSERKRYEQAHRRP